MSSEPGTCPYLVEERNFDSAIEPCAPEDISVHVGEANSSISPIFARELHESSLQHAPRVCIESLSKYTQSGSDHEIDVKVVD